MDLKEYIAHSYEISTHQDSFPTPPHEYIGTPKEVQKMRQKYCQLSPDGVREWSAYEQRLTEAQEKCQSIIGKALESHFGMSALHPGSFPPQ